MPPLGHEAKIRLRGKTLIPGRELKPRLPHLFGAGRKSGKTLIPGRELKLQQNCDEKSITCDISWKDTNSRKGIETVHVPLVSRHAEKRGKTLIPGRELKHHNQLMGVGVLKPWKDTNSRKGIETLGRLLAVCNHTSWKDTNSRKGIETPSNLSAPSRGNNQWKDTNSRKGIETQCRCAFTTRLKSVERH